VTFEGNPGAGLLAAGGRGEALPVVHSVLHPLPRDAAQAGPRSLRRVRDGPRAAPALLLHASQPLARAAAAQSLPSADNPSFVCLFFLPQEGKRFPERGCRLI